MRLLIYGATVPDTLTPEDIDDDHVPYGFLYGTRACGATMMGIAVAQHGEEADTAELDVPVIEALRHPGNHVYAWALDGLPLAAERPLVRPRRRGVGGLGLVAESCGVLA